MKKIITLVSLLLTVTVGQAQQIINPVSATTSLVPSFGSTVDNTINGVGLDSYPSLSATHEMTTPNNAFYAANDSGTIDFDLGGQFMVEGLSFWNNNAPGPGATGVQGVIVSSSPDGITYTPIPGSPTIFAQVMSPTTPAETFAFTPVYAKFIRFEVTSNYNDPGSLIGFAEVAFTGIISTLNTDSQLLMDAVRVYPNPVADVLTINNSSTVNLEWIKILDMNGRLVKEVHVLNQNVSHVIDVLELPAGIYTLHLLGDSENITKRLVKQ
jgi:hypothetical protein